MKLRKLLSGVTAAIMAISSVAVASFTSVSATSDYDPYTTIWYQGYTPAEIPIVQGNAPAEMAGATTAKIYFDMGPNASWNGATHLITSYQAGFTQGSVDFGGTADASATTDFTGVRTFTLPLKTTMAEGDGYYIGGITKNWATCASQDNYVFGILWVEFLDAEGNVLYTQKEVGEEPDYGTPPTDKLPIRFVNNEGADLCDPLEITEDGTYEMEVTGLNISKSSTDGYGAFGLYNGYANQVIDPGTTITIEELVFNDDVNIEITDAWKNRSAFEGAALQCYPINHWGDTATVLDSSIPDGTIINKIKIKFTIKGCNFGNIKPVAKGEKITKVTYDYTVTEPGTAKFIRWDLSANAGYPVFFAATPISGAGDYTTEVEVSSQEILASIGAYIDASANETDVTVDNVTQTKDTAITLKSITFNDKYTFDTENLELNNKEQYKNGLANIWNDQGAQKVIYQNDEAYIAGTDGVQSNGIKLVLGAPPADEPDDPDDPDNPDDPVGPTGSYDASLMYWSGNDGWNTMKPPSGWTDNPTSVTDSGTYSVAVDKTLAGWDVDGTPVSASGIHVMCIDIKGYAEAIGAKMAKGSTFAQAREAAIKAGATITDVAIIADGETVYEYADDDIAFGDLEGNGNLRIDIFNDYSESGDGDASNYDPPQEIKDLAAGLLEASETMEIRFTLTYTKPATPDKPDNPNNPNNPNNPGNNNNNNNSSNKGGSTVKPVTPVNTTIAPKTTSGEKAAKKIVNKAKIKKLSAKAKGKKASKVTGYIVQVSAKKNFKKVLAKKTLKKNAKKVTLKVKKLKKGTTYWARVRAYKNYKASGKTKTAKGAWKKIKFKA